MKGRLEAASRPNSQFIYVELFRNLFFLSVLILVIGVLFFSNFLLHNAKLFFIITGVITLILGAAYLVISRRFFRNMELITFEIDKIAGGNLEGQSFTEKEDTLGTLALSLENMRSNIKERTLRHQEITTLYRISSVINSILNLEELLKAAISEVVSAFPANYGAILLWNEGKHLLEIRADCSSIPEGKEKSELKNIGELAFNNGEPIIENIEAKAEIQQKFCSSIGAPLIVKERRIGSIELHKYAPPSFTEDDLGLLVIVVSQIAMAVENAKLYLRISEDLQKRLEELGGLYYASQLLSSSLNFQTVLEVLVDLAIQLLFADSAAISIVDEGKEEHRLMAARGLADEFVRGFVQRTGEGLGGLVIEQGVPLWVDDVLHETRFDISQMHKAGIKAVLAVPIKIEDKSIGCVFVSYKESHGFQSHEIKLLTALANQSAIVIRNARLYSKVLEEKAMLDSILFSMGDGVTTLDRDLRITSFNSAAEIITGWNSNEVLGLTCQEVFCGKLPSEDLQLALEVGLYQTPVLSGPPKTHEVLIMTKDGSSKCLMFSPSPLTDGAGNVVGVVAIFKDVSRLKETEQMKTDFLTTVSHELRTPLTSIKGYIATLLHPRAHFPYETQQKFLGVMEREADRLNKLIGDLLDVSRIESNRLEIHPQVTNLVDVIRRKVEMERSRVSERYNINMDLFTEDLPVEADVHYMEYVLEHLLSNAIKYSPDGGEILVSMRIDGEMAVVSVRDHGIGIPFDQQDKVFDRFYRVDNRSTRRAYGPGLGLFIAKRIVESHGGQIWLESVYKEGSVFTFSIPLAGKALEMQK